MPEIVVMPEKSISEIMQKRTIKKLENRVSRLENIVEKLNKRISKLEEKR